MRAQFLVTSYNKGIGDFAFQDCTNLASLTIMCGKEDGTSSSNGRFNSVGLNAFDGCGALDTIIFGKKTK